MQKAVIDRIEDGKHAVLIVGDEEEQKIIPVNELPDGAREGTWLKVKFNGDAITYIAIDHEETAKRRERINSKMNKLKERRSNK